MLRLLWLFGLVLLNFKTAFGFSILPLGHCDQLIHYAYYSSCYSSKHKQSFWTFHFLTPESINGPQKRINDYKADFSVARPVFETDYRGSGYDRGHLVPAGDMRLSYRSMTDTFYMTNMSPQVSSFNAGVWKSLEVALRNEVLKRGPAYVVTAPVLLEDQSYSKLRSGVSIPSHFYKIAYFPHEELMLAFLIPNQRQSVRDYRSFQLSVDELEDLTGYDYFSFLPENLEEKLERLRSSF